ncbi:fumarylacetoacetate hydrolase family protein [Agromyces intestinalis]|uniref:Fumarylacetoacetate hydrolase family protein n=1 Tax=Agromyces intestinalis TaxID=2592652 RepID=A0A5C1YFS5_9MICO|nr:fumarylacetoacetate hydrolase family protein [Agromyces intestinalis]QEO14913.1 fumarylacetoacetate hydrolase family protein [Agromyces intestinalis]
MEHPYTTAEATLPDDAAAALLVGRVWDPAAGGPSVVAVRGTDLVDVTETFPTVRELTEHDDPAAALAAADGPVVAALAETLANTAPSQRDRGQPWLLSPIDLHVVKAAGVTFPVSMIERVIEERAGGDQDQAAAIRADVIAAVGGSLADLVPGSPEAMRLKELLVARGLWSQYLEVGIGPDAELFTKAPVLSSVGTGVDVGVASASSWNNPEPELVLAVSSRGAIVGATLGNDVNLRDVEGRSALLLGKAKDNNASAAVGPFLRLFDDAYSLDDVRGAVVTLDLDGPDGFALSATSPLAEISRDPTELVGQAIGAHHRYPDGFVLYLGTLFAPVVDRGEAGHGFTHEVGDVVRISEPRLGCLANRVDRSEVVEPWEFGIADLFASLARRGLLGG